MIRSILWHWRNCMLFSRVSLRLTMNTMKFLLILLLQFRTAGMWISIPEPNRNKNPGNSFSYFSNIFILLYFFSVHDSMATLIGLSIRVKLLRSLPPRFKVTVEITPGTHTSEIAVNKQLADKERVAAALENSNLINVINQCIAIWSVLIVD